MRFLRALRTIVAALAVGLSASAAMAQASQTRAQLESYVSTNIGPNGVGAVTGTIMQRALLNQAASTFTLLDTIPEGVWGCASAPACVPSSLMTLPSGLVIPNILAPGISVFGDTAGLPWVNAQLPGSENDTPLTAIATTTANYSAGIFATKTSLNTGTPPQSLIGLTTLNYIDNAVQAQVSWAQYGVTIVAANAVYTDGFVIEYTFANYGAAPLVTDPFTTANGYLVAERLDSGAGTASNPISAYIDMVNNGGVADVGIVDRFGSLNMASGKADFLEMPPNHYITWFNALSAPAWTIGTTGNSGAGSILLGTSQFDLYLTPGNAIHALNITSTAINLLLPPAILGSSTGLTTLASANPSASNFTATFPAATDTIVELAQTQTLTNKTIPFALNTLTGVAPLASPTFSGTVTIPDGGTLTSSLDTLDAIVNLAAGTGQLQINAVTTLSRNTSTGALTESTNAGNIILSPGGSGVVNATVHVTASSAAPSVSACGGGTPAITGGDNFGKITAGTGALSSCVINFGTTWGTAPSCVISSTTAIAAETVTTSTTQLTVGGTSLTSVVMTYVCGSTAMLDTPLAEPANDNREVFGLRRYA